MAIVPTLSFVAAAPWAAAPTVGALVGAVGASSVAIRSAFGQDAIARAHSIRMRVARARVEGYDDGAVDKAPLLVAGLLGWAAAGTVGSLGASFVAGAARAAFHDVVDAPLARKRRERAQRQQEKVAGSEVGDDMYKDDNGKLWKIEGDSGILDQVRGTTDAYGGTSTDWRYLRSQVFSDIERRAILLGGVDKAIDAGTGKKSTPSAPTSPAAKSIASDIASSATKKVASTNASISNGTKAGIVVVLGAAFLGVAWKIRSMRGA